MMGGGSAALGSADDHSVGFLLSACLDEARKAHGSLHQSTPGNSDHIAWLERQLSHLISQLQVMQHELESGVPLSSGAWDQLDLAEVLEDSMAEIRNLKSLIQSLRAVAR